MKSASPAWKISLLKVHKKNENKKRCENSCLTNAGVFVIIFFSEISKCVDEE